MGMFTGTSVASSEELSEMRWGAGTGWLLAEPLPPCCWVAAWGIGAAGGAPAPAEGPGWGLATPVS